MEKIWMFSSALLLAAGGVRGQAAAPARPSPLVVRYGLGEIMGLPPQTFSGQLNQMEHELTLSDDQLARLKTDVDAMNAAIDAAEQVVFGPPSSDPATIARVKVPETVAALQAQVDQIAAENEVKILADLTGDQKIAWARSTLESLIKMPSQSLKLTAAQSDKTNALLADAARELAAATSVPAYTGAQAHMIRQWITGVLTDQQIADVLRDTPPLGVRGRAVNVPSATRARDRGMP